MNKKKLAFCLKTMIIGVGIGGLIVYGLILPMLANIYAPFVKDPLAKYLWLGFFALTGLPCYAVLVLSWRVCTDIGRERAFTVYNAVRLKLIALLAGFDTVFLLLGNVVLFLLGKNDLVMMTFCLFVIFAGIVLSVAFAALSHLVMNAAELQDQCDLTI